MFRIGLAKDELAPCMFRMYSMCLLLTRVVLVKVEALHDVRNDATSAIEVIIVPVEQCWPNRNELCDFQLRKHSLHHIHSSRQSLPPLLKYSQH